VLQSRCPPALLARLRADDGLTAISDPGRTHRHLMKVATSATGAVTAAWLPEKMLLVGYVTIHDPDPESRWGMSPLPGLLELGSLEVGCAWRGQGLSGRLLAAAFADPGYEDKIVISNEYVWHWDLEATGLTKWKYRIMLRRTLARVGFEEVATDEPNIRWDPANIFMVRIGPRAPLQLLRLFQERLIQGY